MGIFEGVSADRLLGKVHKSSRFCSIPIRLVFHLLLASLGNQHPKSFLKRNQYISPPPKMSHPAPECQATCPPTTVTVQPPPFILHIPGPGLFCPDQPFHIEQHNPCVTGGGGPARPALFADRAAIAPRYTSYFENPGPFWNANGCRY
ncbi:hypothetical protein lerEdw1_015907 [Lerista edwardsae]|nr:hypothetical protein lerEdw1_015907 [Lerista edwardsae]